MSCVLYAQTTDGVDTDLHFQQKQKQQKIADDEDAACFQQLILGIKWFRAVFSTAQTRDDADAEQCFQQHKH